MEMLTLIGGLCCVGFINTIGVVAAGVQHNAWGCNWSTLFMGEINTGTWPYRLGESKISVSKLLLRVP
jgi:hypothetical protein